MYSKFQSLTRDSNHSNGHSLRAGFATVAFQSLTRDSNHSNLHSPADRILGIEFQSLTRDSNHSNKNQNLGQIKPRCFNPSRGIAIIQTRQRRDYR